MLADVRQHDAAVLAHDGLPRLVLALGDGALEQLETEPIVAGFGAQEAQRLFAAPASQVGQRQRLGRHAPDKSLRGQCNGGSRILNGRAFIVPSMPASFGSTASCRRESVSCQADTPRWTNRKIGAELGVSERTVDTHVRHVLRKLGAVKRAQIASWITLQIADDLANAR